VEENRTLYRLMKNFSEGDSNHAFLQDYAHYTPSLAKFQRLWDELVELRQTLFRQVKQVLQEEGGQASVLLDVQKKTIAQNTVLARIVNDCKSKIREVMNQMRSEAEKMKQI